MNKFYLEEIEELKRQVNMLKDENSRLNNYIKKLSDKYKNSVHTSTLYKAKLYNSIDIILMRNELHKKDQDKNWRDIYDAL